MFELFSIEKYGITCITWVAKNGALCVVHIDKKELRLIAICDTIIVFGG